MQGRNILLSCLALAVVAVGPADAEAVLQASVDLYIQNPTGTSDINIGDDISGDGPLVISKAISRGSTTEFGMGSTASGFAASNYGILRGIASADYNDNGFGTARSNVTASWQDFITVTSDTLLSGTPVTFEGILALHMAGESFVEGSHGVPTTGGTARATVSYNSGLTGSNIFAAQVTPGAGSTTGAPARQSSFIPL